MKNKVLVCGAGSIGIRHIQNLLNLGAEVIVWRNRIELLEQIKTTYGIQVMTNLDSAIQNVDAVVVATATDQHITIAEKVLKYGKSLFIEKPLSNNLEGIEEIGRLAKGKVIEVGCQFRVHPNLIKFQSILADKHPDDIFTYRLVMGFRLDAWRVKTDYKESYSADASRGGGALFDLIHQIDIANWLFGPVSKVQASLTKRSKLAISGDDISNLLLTHESGMIGHIQLDMVSPVYRCDAEVVTNDAIYKWSYLDGILRRITDTEDRIIDKVQDNFERNTLFIEHMKYFLKRIENPELPAICSFEDGRNALSVALAARESDIHGKTIRLV